MTTFHVIEDTAVYPDSPLIATVTREQAERVNAESFDGEASIREVTEQQLRALGFDPAQVREEHS